MLPCSPDFLSRALHVWGSTKTEQIQPADADDRHCAWNSSHFDHRQGEGGQWVAHLLLQSCITDWKDPDVHCPFFVLQTNPRTAWIWLSRPQVRSDLRKGKGKHMVWRDEHKDALVSHMLENETVLQYFWNSIRNQEHQLC
jgi:hypothetical protein